MKIFYTESAKRDFQKLPIEVQKITEKQFQLLLSNPKHPSLRIKKVKGTKNIWEGRITKSIRFTFQIGKDTYILRRIGKHNQVLRKP